MQVSEGRMSSWTYRPPVAAWGSMIRLRSRIRPPVTVTPLNPWKTPEWLSDAPAPARSRPWRSMVMTDAPPVSPSSVQSTGSVVTAQDA